MKKILKTLPILVITAFLYACGGNSTPSNQDTTTPTKKVVIPTPTPKTYNQQQILEEATKSLTQYKPIQASIESSPTPENIQVLPYHSNSTNNSITKQNPFGAKGIIEADRSNQCNDLKMDKYLGKQPDGLMVNSQGLQNLLCLPMEQLTEAQKNTLISKFQQKKSVASSTLNLTFENGLVKSGTDTINIAVPTTMGLYISTPGNSYKIGEVNPKTNQLKISPEIINQYLGQDENFQTKKSSIILKDTSNNQYNIGKIDGCPKNTKISNRSGCLNI